MREISMGNTAGLYITVHSLQRSPETGKPKSILNLFRSCCVKISYRLPTADFLA